MNKLLAMSAIALAVALLIGAGMQGSTDQGFILARGDFSSARSLHDQEDRLPLEEFRTARVVGDFSSSLPG